MLHQLNTYLEEIAKIMPLELYVLIGGFLEEVVAPIPSPLVMITAGGLLKLDGGNYINIIILCLIGAFSKTIGSILLYYLGDKLEDTLVPRFGKYIGIEKGSIESIGKKFTGTWKDFFVLIMLRALPIFPGLPVALACGIAKVNIKNFISTTFIGYFLRSLLFAYIGFAGVESYENLLDSANVIESAMTIIILLILVGAIYFIKKNQENKQSS